MHNLSYTLLSLQDILSLGDEDKSRYDPGMLGLLPTMSQVDCEFVVAPQGHISCGQSQIDWSRILIKTPSC